jgi:hypothetical protein
MRHALGWLSVGVIPDQAAGVVRRALHQRPHSTKFAEKLTYLSKGLLRMEVGYAVGWGTLALINAGLAQGKGRSGLIWFLLSLPLGPIATFLIVMLGRKSS